jgi:predicted transcriptional regulator
VTDTDGRRIGLTIRLDEETARRIGSLATARGTTIDALAAAALASLLSEDARYEESEVGADQLLARSAARGDPAWRRDDVHDRADRG